MVDRMPVTSLMRSSITAAEVPGQRHGVSPREVAGRRARGNNAREFLARGRLPGPLLASDALQVHGAIRPCPAKLLSPDAYVFGALIGLLFGAPWFTEPGPDVPPGLEGAGFGALVYGTLGCIPAVVLGAILGGLVAANRRTGRDDTAKPGA